MRGMVGPTHGSKQNIYEIGKLTVFDIIKSEDKLKGFQSQLQNADCTKKCCIVRTDDFPDVDKAVFLWVVQERAAGVPVSGPVLMVKAALMHQKLLPENRTCCHGMHSLKM